MAALLAGAAGIYDWRRVTTELRRDRDEWKAIAIKGAETNAKLAEQVATMTKVNESFASALSRRRP